MAATSPGPARGAGAEAGAGAGAGAGWIMYETRRVGVVVTDFTQHGEWHLTLAQGDEVLVLGEKPGWYLGSKPDRPKYQGIFPAR